MTYTYTDAAARITPEVAAYVATALRPYFTHSPATMPAGCPVLLLRSEQQDLAYLTAALANFTRHEKEVLFARLIALRRVKVAEVCAFMAANELQDENEVEGDRLSDAGYLQALAVAVSAVLSGSTRTGYVVPEAIAEIANA
jgi:hypothetical protein